MNTSVGSGALCTSPKGETTYFQSNMLDKSDFIIPKKILWKDVEFPGSDTIDTQDKVICNENSNYAMIQNKEKG